MIWPMSNTIIALMCVAVYIILQILLLKLKWTIITNTVLDVLEQRGYGKLAWWKNR